MLSRRSAARRSSAAAAVLVGGLALTMVPGAAAQPTSDEVRGDLGQAEQRLDAIDEELGLAVELYNTAQVALDEVTERLAATRAELAGLRDERSQLAEGVQDHLRRLHKMGPALELSTVVFAGDPTAAGTKAWAMGRILDDQRTDLEALDANQVALDATGLRMQHEQEQAESRAHEQEQARAEVAAMFARTEEEVRELTAVLADTVEAERRAAEEARRRREAEAAAAREAEREAERQAERQAAAEAAAPAPSASSGSSSGSTTSTAPTSTVPTSTAPTSTPAPGPAPSTRQSADVAVRTAVAQLGKPYQWGGSGPNRFDCSGLTSFAWRAAGVTIPRTSGTQYSGTKRITRGQLQPGDLVFYHSPISHVAMYIGNGQVVEAPNSGNNVRIRSDGLTRRGIVGYGRP